LKICPKCGYQDPPYWLASRHRQIEFTKRDYLLVNEPKIAKKLILGEVITNGYYAYLLRPSGTVERVPKHLYDVGGESAFYMPHEKRKDPFQRKLI